MKLDDKILSVDSDDDNLNYNEFNEYLKKDTCNKKFFFIKEVEKRGDILLNEINIKNKKNEVKKNQLIQYILKYSDYSIEELKSYSFNDVRNIYQEIKKENRPFILKFIHYLLNFD